MKKISIKINHKLSSESNLDTHWTKKKKRKDAIKFLVKCELLRSIQEKIQLPCKVSLTRISSRKLDDDNLQGAFKSVRDMCAAVIMDDFRLGRADNDPRITWIYSQKKGLPKENAFEIEIESP